MLEAFPKSLGSGPFGAGDEHAALTACNFEAELSKSMPPRISRAACSIERSLGSGSAVSTVQNILQCPDARAHLTPEEKSVELWGIRVGRRLLKPQTVTWLRDVLQEGELTRSASATVGRTGKESPGPAAAAAGQPGRGGSGESAGQALRGPPGSIGRGAGFPSVGLSAAKGRCPPRAAIGGSRAMGNHAIAMRISAESAGGRRSGHRWKPAAQRRPGGRGINFSHPLQPIREALRSSAGLPTHRALTSGHGHTGSRTLPARRQGLATPGSGRAGRLSRGRPRPPAPRSRAPWPAAADTPATSSRCPAPAASCWDENPPCSPPAGSAPPVPRDAAATHPSRSLGHCARNDRSLWQKS